MPYALQLARKGLQKACQDNPALAQGLNIRDGKITNRAVADTFGLECEAA
jgi:alanine dehydrogenase